MLLQIIGHAMVVTLVCISLILLSFHIILIDLYVLINLTDHDDRWIDLDDAGERGKGGGGGKYTSNRGYRGNSRGGSRGSFGKYKPQTGGFQRGGNNRGGNNYNNRGRSSRGGNNYRGRGNCKLYALNLK